MMDDFEERQAKDELKRADHLIYVTLKYTRTVDVIKNTVKRLITALEYSIADSINHLKIKGKVKDSIPAHPNLRSNLLLQLIPKSKKAIDFYNYLRKIERAEYGKKEEYRKNVALLAKDVTQGKIVEVNVEVLKQLYNQTVVFVTELELLTNPPSAK